MPRIAGRFASNKGDTLMAELHEMVDAKFHRGFVVAINGCDPFGDIAAKSHNTRDSMSHKIA